MNPVLKNKSNIAAYYVLILVSATLYAVLFGIMTGLDSGCVAVNAVVFAVTFSGMGLLMWSILKYAVPKSAPGYLRVIIIVMAGLMAVTVITGTETLAMYACLDHGFTDFARTIPLRAFMATLGYVIIVLYYLKDYDSGDNKYAEESPATAGNAASDTLERITVRGGQKIKVIHVSEIEYLQAEGDYVGIVTHEGRWLKEQTMKYFEEHLPQESFVRIHRSYIVAAQKIVRIERYGNLYQVVLRNGEKIKVSANGYKVLKERLNL